MLAIRFRLWKLLPRGPGESCIGGFRNQTGMLRPAGDIRKERYIERTRVIPLKCMWQDGDMSLLRSIDCAKITPICWQVLYMHVSKRRTNLRRWTNGQKRTNGQTDTCKEDLSLRMTIISLYICRRLNRAAFCKRAFCSIKRTWRTQYILVHEYV